MDEVTRLRHAANRADLVAARDALAETWRVEDEMLAKRRAEVMAAYDQGLRDLDAVAGEVPVVVAEEAAPAASPTIEVAVEPVAEPAAEPAAEPVAEPAPDAPPADAT